MSTKLRCAFDLRGKQGPWRQATHSVSFNGNGTRLKTITVQTLPNAYCSASMSQANEYKYEIERLTVELSDMKRRYFAQKRRELAKPGALVANDVTKLPAIANPSQTRYMGGGFSLATQPS